MPLPLTSITDDQLKLVEKYAALFLIPAEIAILIDVDKRVFFSMLKDESSPVYKAYMLGKVNSMLSLRENIIKLAKNGSPQAEMLIKDLIRKQELAENKL